MSNAFYPLRFEPIFKPAIWGGHSLRPMYGQPAPTEPEGEAWVLSDQGDSLSRVANGPHAGRTLRDLMNENRHELIGSAATSNGRFPLLLKFLDAREPLSVQVHPNDEQARSLASASAGLGKTEAWVIVRSAPGSLLYAGLKPGVDGPRFSNALRRGRLPETLHSYHARPGDCIFLEAGVVHAIGAGLMLFEVQQTRDITFRLSDWDRLDVKTGKPRQLHIEESLLCANVERGPCDPVAPLAIAPNRESLVKCRYFTLDRVHDSVPFPVGIPGACRVVVVIEGKVVVHHADDAVPLGTGDVVLLPAALGSCKCVPDGQATILECGVV